MKIGEIIKKEWLLIALVFVLAIGTRFIYFGYPKEIVFDELYFAKFSTDYFKGTYYFDIHPPLAKLMMAGFAKVSGVNLPTTFDFKNISQTYPDNSYKLLRLFVSIFGVVLPLAVYYLSKQLFRNKWPAFLAGLFTVFDNALLVQSRFILMDVVLLAFGVLGLGFFLAHRRKRSFSWSWFAYLILSAIFLAAAFSVKWTALIFFGLAGAIILFDVFRHKQIKDFIIKAIIIGVVSFLFYFSVFAVHLKMLPKSGDGDAFMSASFQKTLVGNQFYHDSNIKPAGLFRKFVELNTVMYSANAGLTATHPYGSKWYSWPFLSRPIYYWYHDDGNNAASRIYLQGNPFIWWLGFIVVVYYALWCLAGLSKKNKKPEFWPIGLMILGYLGNLVPYIFVSRVAFLYHYFPSLIFLIVLLGFFVWKYFKKYPLLIGVVILITIVFFIFFAPLSYGLSLTEPIFNSKIWFRNWL